MKIFFAAVLGAGIFLVGCQGRTEVGECVGMGDHQEPGLEYHASTRNIVVGIIFIETLVVPVVVALDEFYCPIARVSGPRIDAP